MGVTDNEIRHLLVSLLLHDYDATFPNCGAVVRAAVDRGFVIRKPVTHKLLFIVTPEGEKFSKGPFER